MVEHASKHSHSHSIAKLDHTCGKAFARLREVLHEASGSLVPACDRVDRELVAKVTQLEGCIEATIDTCGISFFRISLRQGFRAVSPTESQLSY